MLYTDPTTPPFNSPYQQHSSRQSQSVDSPYPSPVRHDLPPKSPHGLGLYNYQSHLVTGLPPSPQPSVSWTTPFSTGGSPLMSEALADPWTSGAFDHPVSRSPLPWASAQTSPRSSMSSYTREMSVYSRDGSEQPYPVVKIENSGWHPEGPFGTGGSAEINTLSLPGSTELSGLPSRSHPQHTIAPERLHADMYPYGTAYTSPMSRYHQASAPEYVEPKLERAPSEESSSSVHSRGRMSFATSSAYRERMRSRRHTDPDHAAYRCHLCPEKGFARRYNFNQHMLTHDISRRKEHVCPYTSCGKEFVRKTDLARHDQSVHRKSKPFGCNRCGATFSRKDTLKRYAVASYSRILIATNVLPGMKKTVVLVEIKSPSLDHTALHMNSKAIVT